MLGRLLGSKLGLVCVAAAALPGCAGTPVAPPRTAERTETLGLRVSVSSQATSVCVFAEGCAGAPQGAIQLRPLEPSIREAVSQALVAAGFELVDAAADGDLLADVEWRGTDTLSLRLQDTHGRFVDQSSYRRSLERCRDLPKLTWDSCWAANFLPMKEALARPLRSSPAVRALVRKAEPGPSPAVTALGHSASQRPAPGAVTRSELSAGQIQETVAQHREELQRACWLPAVEARDPSAPSSARVATSLSIDASGKVLAVTTGGDPLGYPRLSGCITSQVQGWHFPSAAGPSRVNIPFVFASD